MVLSETDQDHRSIEFSQVLQVHRQLTNHHYPESSTNDVDQQLKEKKIIVSLL